MDRFYRYRFIVNLIFAITTFMTFNHLISPLFNMIIGFCSVSYILFSIFVNPNRIDKLNFYFDLISVLIISTLMLLSFYRWKPLEQVISLLGTITVISLIYLFFRKKRQMAYIYYVVISICFMAGLIYI
jgi:hypothetical protein